MSDNIKNEQSIPKLVFKNAIPAITAMIMVVIYNMADLFFIGQTGNDYMVAAVSLATPVFMLFMALASIFGIGGTSIISRSFGAGNNKYAQNVSAFCFWGSITVGGILSLLIILFADNISVLLGGSVETVEMVSSYLRVLAISGPFILLSSTFSNIVRAEGSPMSAAIGMLLGNIVNIILDPVFILGFELGVTGAAIATVIGNIASGLYYVYYLNRKTEKLSINIKDFKMKDGVLKNVLLIGIPASLASLLMSISTLVANGVMASYGDLAVAGLGVAMKVMMITTFVAMGFGQGIQPVLGYLVGAKDDEKFRKVIRFSLISSTIISVTMTLGTFLALKPIVSAFVTDPNSFDYAFSFTRTLLLTSSTFGMFFVLVNTLQAMGAAKASLITSVSRQGLVYIPMILILNATFGVNGAILAQPVADIVSVLILFYLYRTESRKMYNINIENLDPQLSM